MERGRGGRQRRGGGGGRRPYRGRGTGGDREHVYRGHRGPAREHTGTPEARKQDADDGGERAEVSEERSGGFSRRKLLSNWERYEAAEKEEKQEAAGGSAVVRRGEEYSVLLSSAGDSYSQFRLSEEKEWGSGTGEAPGGCADYTVLLTALQALPLHITLNIEEELVQEGLPQELPHFIPTMRAQPPPSGATPSSKAPPPRTTPSSKAPPPRTTPSSQPLPPRATPSTQSPSPGATPSSQPLPPRATPSSQPLPPRATPSSQPPSPGATPSSQPPPPRATPLSQPPSPGATPSSQAPPSGATPPHQTLDQELDFLLGLEAPVLEGTAESPVQKPEEPTMTDDVCLTAEEEAKAVTAEDLEDWLDAMIA